MGGPGWARKHGGWKRRGTKIANMCVDFIIVSVLLFVL